MHRRKALTWFAAGAAAAIAGPASVAWAEDKYPTRPIRVICPFPPGGATDNSARVVAEAVQRYLDQPWVIDNRTGANGRIGTELVSRSPADGYLLLFGGIGALTIAPHLEKVGYDAKKDFTPVIGAVTYDTVLVVNDQFPVRDVKQLIAYLQKNGDKVSYGSSGTGGPYHMTSELFKSMAKVNMTHVPYKGDGAAILDLAAGHVQVMFTSVSAASPHIQSGRIRLIAMGGNHRSAQFPDVPTVAEQALPEFASDSWAGVFGPAGLPKDVVDRTYGAVAKALAEPQVAKIINAQGSTVLSMPPPEFTRFVAAEYDKWGKLIHERDLKVE